MGPSDGEGRETEKETIFPNVSTLILCFTKSVVKMLEKSIRVRVLSLMNSNPGL